MRKFVFVFVVTALFIGVLVSPALAQEDVSVDPGLTPDSPFYFIDTFWKSVRLTFTFDAEKKIEKRMAFARERLAEAEEMSKDNKVEAMEKALERYANQIERAEERAEEKTELADKVAEMTAKHLKVLERVIDKAPEQAKAGLEKALEASEKGHVRAIQILEITDMTKAREFSVQNIEQMKTRVEEQIQIRKEQVEQAQEEIQNRVREKIEENIEDAQKVMEQIRIQEKLHEPEDSGPEDRTQSQKQSRILWPSVDTTNTTDITTTDTTDTTTTNVNDTTKEGDDIVCTAEYDPVCGVDGRTYSNDCYALKDNISIECEGVCPCKTDPEAYFKFDYPPEPATFVIKLTDSAKIQEARDILNRRQTDAIHVMGTIVKESADYNKQWSYHLDPSTIVFFENVVEVCDAGIQYVEDHLDEVGGELLPGNRWCPWGSRLIDTLITSVADIR